MQDANPVSTPLNKTAKLTVPHKNTSPSKLDVPYAKAIGSLMYAALGTRPDLAFTVQHLSQLIVSHGPEYWTAIKYALRYLKGTRDIGIVFRKATDIDLELYVDSDFANRTDARSIGGYMAMFGGSCIAWSSNKQRTVSLSTTGAEYIALTEGAKQLIWLRRALQEHGFDQDQPTSVRSDNIRAINLSHDPTYHARTMHINIAHHYIRQKVDSNEAALTYVRSKENPADIMTKGLDLDQHKYLRERLGMETPRIEKECWVNRKQGSGGVLAAVEPLEVDKVESGGLSDVEDN